MPPPVPSVSLNGNDQLNLMGRTLSDFADGDFANFEFPNDIVATKIGKGGNVIHALNQMGKLCNATLRLIRGSADDIFMNAALQLMQIDFPSFVLIEGTFVKRVGHGNTLITHDTYVLAGGVFKTLTAVKGNAEGDTEQGVAIYHMTFPFAVRAEL